jgi:hypothetical protein
MLRIPHCLDNRLTGGGKAVSLTHWPYFTPQKHYYFYVSGTHFCYRLSKPEGLVRPEGLGKFKKITSSGIEPAIFQFVAMGGRISISPLAALHVQCNPLPALL